MNTQAKHIKRILKILVVGIIITLLIPNAITSKACYIERKAEPKTDVIGVAVTKVEVTKNNIPTVAQPTYTSLGTFKITAYCACEKCCEQWAINRPTDEDGNQIVYGSSGVELIPEYSVAIDPDVIPYGTEILFNGNEYIAHDCGGAIKENRIDLYFDSHEDALEYGVQYHEVFILEKESEEN